ncbi:MAG TPA: allophanate hydrolase [Burkholderiaceae bacterium]|nr:allophanate hydrolase [Burkholderiaceae bacterium]
MLTVADWRRAVADGAPVADLLLARRRRLAASATPHAWIALIGEDALRERCEALRRASAGLEPAAILARMPLFGVPFAAKDNIDAAGFDTTAACPAWARRPERDAGVVRRLLDAGAVLLGKTNLDQFATGLVGTRSPYGAPSSAFDATRVSGGSSSGSAVAVAHGEVAFSLGTDTAGSGRVPAGFNGIVGMKPTPGRIGTSGVLPACRSLDCVSVFALTVDDAAAVLAVAEGEDADDEYARFAPGPAALPPAPRVGVPRRPILDDAHGYDAGWRDALARLESLGCRIVEIDLEPLHAVARQLYDGPWVAERYAAVQSLIEREPGAMDPTVAAIVGRATGLSAVDAFRGQYAVQRGRRLARRLWERIDLMVVPTAPRHPAFAEVAADPVGANAVLGTYTNFVNLLGWSALALPSGTTPAGLPFGITAIGPGDADAALLAWGRAWSRAAATPLGATGARLAGTEPPGAAAPWPATEPTLRLAVVGAHLSGLPLNGQLVERRAVLEAATRTAPCYRLWALPGTTPPRPGLERVAEGGRAIAVEVWRLPLSEVGSFLAAIPSPLGLGTIELAGGERVHGFLCEHAGLAGATDISAHGGWRDYLRAARSTPSHPAGA